MNCPLMDLRGRGSSPHRPDPYGKDDWVRGIRKTNGTSAEWLANERAERLASSPSTINGHVTDDREQRHEAHME